MNKPSKPIQDDEVDDGLGPTPSQEEMEAWLVRNRDAINESIIEARRELAEGKGAVWDTDEILGDLRAEFEKARQG